MIEITVESALSALREAVAEKGEDFLYEQLTGPTDGPSCVYATIGEDGVPVPDCIIGHVLAKHGMPMDEFVWMSDRRGKYSTGIARSVLPRLAEDGHITIEGGAIPVLQRAQSLQDWGYPWGTAYAKAAIMGS